MSAGARFFRVCPKSPRCKARYREGGRTERRREGRQKERRENVEGKCGMNARRGRMEGGGKEIAGRGEMDGVKGGTLGLCWRKQRCEGKRSGRCGTCLGVRKGDAGKIRPKGSRGAGARRKTLPKKGRASGAAGTSRFSVGRGFRCPESRRGKAHPCFFAVGWHCQSPSSGKKARNSWQHDASPAWERSQRRRDT